MVQNMLRQEIGNGQAFSLSYVAHGLCPVAEEHEGRISDERQALCPGRLQIAPVVY